jgi:hypothetical protein
VLRIFNAHTLPGCCSCSCSGDARGNERHPKEIHGSIQPRSWYTAHFTSPLVQPLLHSLALIDIFLSNRVQFFLVTFITCTYSFLSRS